MTCTWCGQDDDKDLTHWFQDTEGQWWHKGCHDEFIERIDARTIKERQDGNGTNDR